MALNTKTNQLTGGASTGTLASTDPGFQPKALFVWMGLNTATGAAADAQHSLGYAGSSTTERVAGYNSDDNLTVSDITTAIEADKIASLYTRGTTTQNVSAILTSLDATGFTLNWTTLTTTSPLYNYLAIGGSDITNVKSGSFAANTSTGDQAVTGVGFVPDVVIFQVVNKTSDGAQNANSGYGFGCATGVGEEWSMSIGSTNGSGTMSNTHRFSSTKCIVVHNSTTMDGLADFVSFDADGFTINWSDAPSSAWKINYMCIKGGQWFAGTETQKTSTGTKATTGTGFTPLGLILGGLCDTTVDSDAGHMRLTLGATTGTSNNVCLWTGDRNAVAVSIVNSIHSATKCIIHATEQTSVSPTTQADAVLSSFDGNGFTLDWTTADATARNFGFLAYAANAGGAAYTQDLTETVTLTDTCIKGATKVLADVVTFTDTCIKQAGKVCTETVTHTDTLIRDMGRILTETITFTDECIKQVGRAFSEVVTFTDDLLKQAGKVLTEEITFTDVLTGIKLAVKELTETITMTDTLVKQTGKVCSEVVTMTDTLIKSTVRTLEETITYTDTLLKQVARTLTETLTFTDTLESLKIKLKTLTEDITLTDTLTRVTSKVLSEVATFTDTCVKATSRVFSEVLTFTDTLEYVATHPTYYVKKGVSALRNSPAVTVLTNSRTVTILKNIINKHVL